MAWVKLDDHFPDHPKIVSAGPLAAWLYVTGLCYCNRLLTDGFIPFCQVDRLSPHRSDQDLRDSPFKLAERLCGLGLWSEVERKGVSGFVVHDYRKYQPSRKQVMADRSKTAERQGRFRERKHNGQSNAVTNTVSNATCNTMSNSVPVPVPVPKKKDQELSSADADFETFRSAYPASRREGGKLAKTAFERATRKQTLNSMLAALAQHQRSEQWQDPKLVPGMLVWLNRERWLQVLPEPTPSIRLQAGGGRACPHDPRCETHGACTTRIISEGRAERAAGQTS